MPFDMTRGKKDDGEQGGSWEVGLEAVSWSERPEQMAKGREKHGKNIIERCEEQGVLFGMSQGAATRRWIIAVGQCRSVDHEVPVDLLPVEELFQWWCTSASIASLASTWVQSPKASNVPAAFRQTVSETLSVAPGRNS